MSKKRQQQRRQQREQRRKQARRKTKSAQTSKPTGRACGSCTECCDVMAIPAVASPCYEVCKHVSKSRCSVYKHRPSACRDYECLYLQTGVPDRPDRCGFVVDWSAGALGDGAASIRMCSWATEEHYRGAQEFARKLTDAGSLVVLMTKTDRRILAPEGFDLHAHLEGLGLLGEYLP